MATKRNSDTLASLSDVRNEVTWIYYQVKSGNMSERMGRSLVQILSRNIYCTNSIIRNSRTTGLSLSAANLGWAA